MRFSIKWTLAAMAYVALASAALGQIQAIWASVLWAVTMLAFCYAALVCCAWDERRRYALGFVIASGVSLANLWMFPSSTLPRQTLVAMGLSMRGEEQSIDASPFGDDPFFGSQYSPPTPIARTVTKLVPATSRIQAANAVGTMLAGLVGCGLGALAYRRGRDRATTDRV